MVVRAGMLIPAARVSVANTTFSKPAWNSQKRDCWHLTGALCRWILHAALFRTRAECKQKLVLCSSLQMLVTEVHSINRTTQVAFGIRDIESSNVTSGGANTCCTYTLCQWALA